MTLFFFLRTQWVFFLSNSVVRCLTFIAQKLDLKKIIFLCSSNKFPTLCLNNRSCRLFMRVLHYDGIAALFAHDLIIMWGSGWGWCHFIQRKQSWSSSAGTNYRQHRRWGTWTMKKSKQYTKGWLSSQPRSLFWYILRWRTFIPHMHQWFILKDKIDESNIVVDPGGSWRSQKNTKKESGTNE